MGAEFWPPTFWLSLLFFFASSFILFFFPRLTLFTIFFTLHFILHPTIYSLKNYFPKLLNTPSFISLNFFLDPCVLEHFCYTSIFGRVGIFHSDFGQVGKFFDGHFGHVGKFFTVILDMQEIFWLWSWM